MAARADLEIPESPIVVRRVRHRLRTSSWISFPVGRSSGCERMCRSRRKRAAIRRTGLAGSSPSTMSERTRPGTGSGLWEERRDRRFQRCRATVSTSSIVRWPSIAVGSTGTRTRSAHSGQWRSKRGSSEAVMPRLSMPSGPAKRSGVRAKRDRQPLLQNANGRPQYSSTGVSGPQSTSIPQTGSSRQPVGVLAGEGERPRTAGSDRGFSGTGSVNLFHVAAGRGRVPSVPGRTPHRRYRPGDGVRARRSPWP